MILADDAHFIGKCRIAHPRACTVLVGVASSPDRAQLLRRGFGDVLSPETSLGELAARASLALERACSLPRYRRVGGLTLDLERRDGFVGSAALVLHPREFAMLWHLAKVGDVGAGRTELLREVWDVHHEPETNSVAVHAFRIRAKLRHHALDAMLQTDRGGRYRLKGLDAGPWLGESAGKESMPDETVLR